MSLFYTLGLKNTIVVKAFSRLMFLFYYTKKKKHVLNTHTHTHSHTHIHTHTNTAVKQERLFKRSESFFNNFYDHVVVFVILQLKFDQTFQTMINFYRRDNFVYNHWGCTQWIVDCLFLNFNEKGNIKI